MRLLRLELRQRGRDTLGIWLTARAARLTGRLGHKGPAKNNSPQGTQGTGGGTVRNMVATPDRRLYLACSGVNKVAVVEAR